MKTNKKMRIKRFFDNHYPKFKDDFIIQLLPKDNSHFIKIEIGDKTFDYYPGKQKLKLFIKEGDKYTSKEKDCSVKDFLKSLSEISGKTYFNDIVFK